ncbi:DUF2637 domain-containing protein [Actinacidiphila sp. bgisy167]|uniref:DUF2637 domain-containing protein n=1 Tax=Actinacidiphila sp. bgisy167 TaxID=3413797 RepID=UPI003D7251E7
MSAIRLNRTHRILIGVVVTGAVVIAAIGFAGSYAAVRELALRKGFGAFANVFPIGIDAGIVVLLALDLLLTWLRIPFPLLRQTAWLLTAATIAFNGAAAWPDPLGVGMHGIIPILFVVAVEAARHAIGRIADITADKHMESVRITRWLLAPFATFRLWRRMKLWELRSYEEVIRVEQERLVYRARLRARYGRSWRRKAPVEALMPLKLARYGVPLEQTAALGLAAAGIDPPAAGQASAPVGLTATAIEPRPAQAAAPAVAVPDHESRAVRTVTPAQAPMPSNAAEEPNPWFAAPQSVHSQGGYDPHEPSTYGSRQQAVANDETQQQPVGSEAPQQAPVPHPRAPEPDPAPTPTPVSVQEQAPEPPVQVPNGAGGTRNLGERGTDAVPSDEDLYRVFRQSIEGEGMPTPGAFAANIKAVFGLQLQARDLNQYLERFAARLNNELMEDHIA